MLIFSDMLSPGKHPDFESSIVAVMVLPGMEILLQRLLLRADLEDEGIGPSLELEFPLIVLSALVATLVVLWTSLGAGLRGFALSTNPH